MLNVLLGGGSTMEKVYLLVFYLVTILVSLTFHEFGHAYMAHRMGDDTAKNMGRMTLNPLSHIDITGFIMIMLIGFGWAKPVPVNPRNYNNPRKGEFLVSIAGVTMNLFLAAIAVVAMLTLKWTGNVYMLADSGNIFTEMSLTQTAFTTDSMLWLYMFLYIFAGINCGLFVFNLLPIAPLDGSHIFELLLIRTLGPAPFLWLRRNGRFVLIGVFLVSVFLSNSFGISPINYLADGLLNGVYTVFNGVGKLSAALFG